MKTLYAIRSIEHNGITVCYAVDFRNMTLTICDSDGKPKDYKFSGRWIEYEKWWKDIMEAINLAMKEWFEELRQRKKEKESEEIDMIVAVHEALNK